MPGISPVLKELVIEGLLLARVRAHLPSKVGLGLHALSATLMIAGIIFLIKSGYLGFLMVLPPVLAALAMAVSLLIVACLISVIGNSAIKKKRMRQVSEQRDLSQTIHTLIEVLEQELGEPIRDNPKMALMAAGLAGVFAGRRLS